jgi:hypothetical protein
MAQVTSNTQIDTINILTEASSANDTDMFLLQRGSISYKIKKGNLILPSSQIANIGSKTVLGNIGGSSAAPSEVTILDSNDVDSNLDTALVTEKRIKDYVDNNISGVNDENGWVKLPNGLIMQWGMSERTTAFQEDEIITFPLEFPTQCLNVVGIPDRTSFKNGNLGLYIKTFNRTTATFIYDSDDVTYENTAIRWQAFGH